MHDIDSALNSDSYDPMDTQLTGKFFSANLVPGRKKDVDRFQWTDQPHEERGCQRQCNVLKGVPGLRIRSPTAKAVNSELDAFVCVS